MQKKPAKMSVPKFGAWDKKPPGVPTDYSLVFGQARANKKNQKTDLSEVKRLSLGNERLPLNTNHGRGRGRAREDPPVMVREHFPSSSSSFICTLFMVVITR